MIIILLFASFAISTPRIFLFSTSDGWSNYRHSGNVFRFAHEMLIHHIERESIFIGVGEDHSLNIRNKFLGKIIVEDSIDEDFYHFPNISGMLLTKDTFSRILTRKNVVNYINPQNKLSKQRGILYLCGHGGFEFIRFHQNELLTAKELAKIIERMKIVYQIEELLVIIDTCQAITLGNYIKTPNVTIMASSRFKTKAVSDLSSMKLSVPLQDKFTQLFIDGIRDLTHKKSILDLYEYIKGATTGPIPELQQFNCTRNPNEMLISDFFGS